MSTSAALAILVLDLIAFAILVWFLLDLLTEVRQEAQAKRIEAEADAAAERLREQYRQARRKMARDRR